MISFQKYPQLIVAAVLVSILLPLLSASPASAAPYCGQVWGSTPERNWDWDSSHGRIVDVRAGKHACFDRLVVDLNGRQPVGYAASYVDQVIQDGSGDVVPVKGGAKLQITLIAPAYNSDYGNPIRQSDMPSVQGYRTFRDVQYAGSWEGLTDIGLGVRARLPFRVFTLVNPSRLVVDVAHRW